MKSVMKCIFGSKLYGTSTPESDTDYKEIFVPSPEDILYGKYQDVISSGTGNSGSKNSSDDIDHDKYSLRKFVELLCDGDTFALDALHANKESIVSMEYPAVWEYIYANRSKFYTTNMKSYLGYVRKQAAKYGVKGSRMAALRKVVEVLEHTDDVVQQKYSPLECPPGLIPKGIKVTTVKVGDIKETLPVDEFLRFVEVDIPQKGGKMTFYEVLGRRYQMTITVAEMKKSIYKLWDEYGERARAAEANEGIDWKALSHAYRAGIQIKEIYETGDLVFPLKESETILKIKKGELPFSEVRDMLEDVVNSVEILSEQKRLEGMRADVDREFWKKFVIDVHAEVVKNYKK